LKADIHQRLWPGTFVSDATLAGLVKELRRALHDTHAGTLIRTAHRVGFAFGGATEADAASPVAPAATHWLIVGTRSIPLHDGANLIGRDPDATIWLDVPGVSRRHAQIIVENGAAMLEDLGSKNGTLLRDLPVRGRVALHNADRIQVANELLMFYGSTSGLSTATQPASPRDSSDR
jgi:FHA domain